MLWYPPEVPWRMITSQTRIRVIEAGDKYGKMCPSITVYMFLWYQDAEFA